MTVASRQRDNIGFVFQEPTLMPWATVCRQCVPAAQAWRRRQGAAARRGHGGAGARRPCRLRRGLSARTVRRHADARVDRARAGHRAASAADGRAVRRARRDHPLQAQRRSAGAVAGAAPDRGVRHPFGVRVGLSVAAHRGDDAAARPRLRRDRHRRRPIRATSSSAPRPNMPATAVRCRRRSSRATAGAAS